MKRTLLLLTLFLLPWLAGCDVLQDRLGIPNKLRIEAEGKAIGSACRNAGRGLEDCYRLYPDASKSAVFEGWKEMNEYMLKNKMETIEPQIPIPPPVVEAPAEPHAKAEPVADKAEAKTEAKADAHAAPAAHGEAPAGGH